MEFFKKFAFFFFLIFPFVGGWIPEFKMGPIMANGERVFMLLFLFFLLYLWLIENGGRIRFSKLTLAFIAFSVYMLLNRVIQDRFVPPELVNTILPIGFLVFIDNMQFQPKDLRIFTKVLVVVAIGTFGASFYQLFVDPYFYAGSDPSVIASINHYEVADGIYRNNSLYRGIGANEGAIAMGYLSVFFLFMNFYKYRPTYLLITFLLIFSVFVVFAKYCWLMFLIGFFFFLYYRYHRIRWVIFFLGAVGLFLIYFVVGDTIEQSTIYQNRVAASTYLGRTESTSIFFEKFFMRKPVFGFGMSSWDNPEYMSLFYIGIHVGLFDVLFRGGLVGTLLLGMVMYQVFTAGNEILRKTGNPIFIAFLLMYILINTTAVFIPFEYYGYYIMLFYLSLYYQVCIRDKHNASFHLNKPRPRPRKNSLGLVRYG